MTRGSPAAASASDLGPRRLLSGCFTLLALAALLAVGLWQLVPQASRVSLDRKVYAALVGASALLYAFAGSLVWGLLGYWGLLGAARKAKARASQQEPRTVQRGRVVADGPTLIAPLSGTPCVAYAYRLWREPASRRRRGRLPRYGGLAAVAFALDVDGQRRPVRAFARVQDEWQQLDGAPVLQRARQWVAQTAFQDRGSYQGAIGLVADLAGATVTQWLQPGQPLREDWHNPGTEDDDLGQLHLEERVLPLGAEVTLAGHWNADQQAFVPPASDALPTLVATSAEGRASIDALAGTQASPATALVLVAVLAVFASGLLAAACLR